MEDQPRTRRSLLDVLLGLGTFGLLGSILYPVLRFMRPLAAASAGGPVHLKPDEVTKLARERFVILRAGPSRIIVFEDAAQKLRALDAKCTHEGCTVQYVPGDNGIWCACHNGRFDLDGRVVSGPPPRPLKRFTCQREADGGVMVRPAAKDEA